MKPPEVVSSLFDADYNVTFEVIAYRTLTRDELRAAVQEFRAQPKIMQRKTPLRNRTITIVTSIGAPREA